MFRIDVPRGAKRLHVATHGSGAVLYIRRGSPPSTRAHDHRGSGSITVRNPAPGAWYVLLHGERDYRGVTLVASTRHTTNHHRREDIKVLRPGRGQHLRAGQRHTVTWRATRGVRRVRIELSYDDGRTWRRSGVTVSASSGKHELFVPKRGKGVVTTRQGRVRVVDANNSSVYGISDRFTIVSDPPRTVPRGHTGRRAGRLGKDSFEPDNKKDHAAGLIADRVQIHTIDDTGFYSVRVGRERNTFLSSR